MSGHLYNFNRRCCIAKHDAISYTNLQYQKTGHGSHCNQAIMLVTDGAPYTYEDIFDQFNWPHLQVRVFTYLIGREVTEIRPLRWMACANKGK